MIICFVVFVWAKPLRLANPASNVPLLQGTRRFTKTGVRETSWQNAFDSILVRMTKDMNGRLTSTRFGILFLPGAWLNGSTAEASAIFNLPQVKFNRFFASFAYLSRHCDRCFYTSEQLREQQKC